MNPYLRNADTVASDNSGPCSCGCTAAVAATDAIAEIVEGMAQRREHLDVYCFDSMALMRHLNAEHGKELRMTNTKSTSRITLTGHTNGNYCSFCGAETFPRYTQDEPDGIPQLFRIDQLGARYWTLICVGCLTELEAAANRALVEARSGEAGR